MACIILGKATRPIKPTYLMYQTNINNIRLKEILEELLKKKLIRRTDVKPAHKRFTNPNVKRKRYLYQTTKKGLEFVKKWNELKKLWRQK